MKKEILTKGNKDFLAVVDCFLRVKFVASLFANKGLICLIEMQILHKLIATITGIRLLQQQKMHTNIFKGPIS